ncbi:hypothetical protein [Longirhabdus pacifica]|uniref:hypothetical protein n=1 Tax=Longirhabdus pacifica TaxID=2305227 RepID=UPI0013E8A0D0|nr:hypothetical protein [Longirhabdus pacifica]
MEILFIFLWFIIGSVVLLCVYTDASQKKGDNIGCLWTLVVFATGPIGLIAYLMVRNSD